LEKQKVAAAAMPDDAETPAKPAELVDRTEALAVFVDDDFAKARPETWEVIRGQWEHLDGHLAQKEIGGTFYPLVTRSDHPRDFVATLEIKPTGGTVYRSVGLSFDWVEDRDFQAVYLSAKDGGSSVSAFHRAAGADAYPLEALVPQDIKVGQRAKLEVLVRGDVLNVKVDDQLKLAYRLPVARRAGKFAIWTFDASAEFYRVRVTELPAEIELAPPTVGTGAKSPESPASTLAAAVQAAALGEKKLATAEARLVAIRARVAAETARHRVGVAPPAADVDQLARDASRAERLATAADADEKLLAATQELERAQAAAEKTGDAAKPMVEAANQKVTDAQKALDEAKRAAAEESTSYQPLGPTYPQTSTGRRLALARWIVDRRNPLTARVAVNHIWMRHFGRPLVDNVEDFGLRSPTPPLADLLDFLAVELMGHDWSMKHVHRLLVTSEAYRMSSSADVAGRSSVEKDPDNRTFWRMNARRMEAEVVRDSVLHAAGGLDPASGGPDIDPAQGLAVPRRSLYLRHARERQVEWLLMFDAANPQECYRRQESVRPQQAFALVNSSLTLGQSRKLAARLIDSAPTDDDFVLAVFETVLSRRPSEAERAACLEFLGLQARQLAEPAKLEILGNADDAVPPSPDPAQRARENLVLVLFNHNDFVTIR
jgi:hypothetical protein